MKYLSSIKREADKVAGNVLSDAFSQEMTREFNYEDMAMVGLLENIINQVKSLEILHKEKHNTSVDIILRAIFENYVYLKFLLKNDTALRGKAYQYSVRLSEFSLIDKLMEKTLEGKRLREFVGEKLDDIEKIYEKNTRSEQRKKIEDEYLGLLGMKHLGQKWYNFDGKTKNLKVLCQYLGMETEYEFIYSLLSKEAHGKDANQWFDIKEYLVSIKESGNYKDNFLHIQLASMYLMESVKLIYDYYGLKKRKKHFEKMLEIHIRLK